MDRSRLFLDQFLGGELPSEFIYTPVERGPELAGDTGATFLRAGGGGMSLGDLRRRLRQAEAMKDARIRGQEMRLQMRLLDDENYDYYGY